MTSSKHKISINDPIHGFISIQNETVESVLNHPYFQRLRRIKQLGLLDLVYPGANHTRFHHALGAMHLMCKALDTLRSKGIEISDEEYTAATIAILLHDIGHGPLSHSLEFTFLPTQSHEQMSLKIMEQLNQQMNQALNKAIAMYIGSYNRPFFYQMITGQLDLDRIDYLQRDSFFTGVLEGTIGSERIIQMLHVANEQLVIEEKGIYSVEKLIIARRLMYWQVYLHKTAISAEAMLKNLLARAKEIVQRGDELPMTPTLKLFLEQINEKSEKAKNRLLQTYIMLDDYDIWGSIKWWQHHKDPVIKILSNRIMNRDLLGIHISNKRVSQKKITPLISKVEKYLNVSPNHASFFVATGVINNAAYTTKKNPIKVLKKSGKTIHLAAASDLSTIQSLGNVVKKHFLCAPKLLLKQLKI